MLSGLSHYRLLRRFLLFGPSTRCCARNKHLLRPSIVCRCRYCCPGWLSVVTICLVAMNITRTNAVRALFLHHFLDLGHQLKAGFCSHRGEGDYWHVESRTFHSLGAEQPPGRSTDRRAQNSIEALRTLGVRLMTPEPPKPTQSSHGAVFLTKQRSRT